MGSQDTPRKILRIDDATTGDETNGDVKPPSQPLPPQSFATPSHQQRPSTRSTVGSQIPSARASGPVPPEQKFESSYKRFQEIKEQTMLEMQEMEKMQRMANSPPSVQSQPVLVDVPAPVIQTPTIQHTEQLQSDLSLLALAGRIEEEVVVGGFKFKLSTLTSGQQDEVVAAVSLVSGDDLVKLGQLRLQILARAIKTVNNVPLEHLTSGEGSPTEKKITFLRSLQITFIMKLFDVYSDLLTRSEKVFEAASEKSEILKN